MKNTIKTIWVNPVERISHQGRHMQTYVIRTENGFVPTVSKRKSRESNTATEYQFPYNTNTGRLYTTLDNLITNPFYEMTADEIRAKYPISEIWNDVLNKITKQPQIKKQTFLEIKHGVLPEYYTSAVSHIMTSMPSDIKEFNKKNFLSSFKLILYARPNRFTDETPRQELMMCMIEALVDTGIIAKNDSTINSSLHDFYVSQENEAAEKEAKTKELIEDAVYNFVKLKREFGDYRTYQMGIILRDEHGQSIMKGKLSREAVNNVISDYINNRDAHQMIKIDKFNETYDLIDNNEFEMFDIKYLVQQALNTNIISHRDNNYVWHSKASFADVYNLGTSFDKMVNFFYNERVTFNPNSEITNWYGDLLNELKSKNIWIE